ncbi:UBX domain-containing protein 3 [Hondaea fermentalgiana]|uniref:UBX domain-containing protein 3 n=1 Tax=Hondaea fermentalgiana TaxID=2315210 RepID=A0A2R5G090_9STRA|nr:UBX domain-containing protein 3 [Hondaea fermentalgiana]|eukprot:GBG24446.1 UBX domain-containing protein 3 [Hondaea fermentalgiana]
MPNIVSLDALKNKGGDAEGGNSGSGAGGNEYYAGGAGSNGGGGSGQNVVVPGEGGDGNAVNRIFQRAAAESEAMGTDLGDAPSTTLTMYRNGFVVGDGPFRELGVPANDQFLASISEGFCPSELVVNGQPAALKINDKRSEDYVPPPYVAFSGGGQSAGGAISTSDSSVITPSEAKADAVTVDENEPKIRVQVIFAHNRKRQVFNFNKTHTVRDLISVVDASGNVSSAYQLLHSVRGPPKPVSGDQFSLTLVDAGLAGAAVTVKTL